MNTKEEVPNFPAIPGTRAADQGTTWLWIIPLILVGILILVFLILTYPKIQNSWRSYFKAKKSQLDHQEEVVSQLHAEGRSILSPTFSVPVEDDISSDHHLIIDVRQLETRPASTPLPAYNDLFPCSPICNPYSPSTYRLLRSRSECHSPSSLIVHHHSHR
jgi:hypothetical protein